MKKPLIALVALLLFCTPLGAQEADRFRVVFYNVENLFDTQKDSCHNDEEFLPTAVRHWNYGRYKTKLANVSKVITAVGEWTPPALVGLCEVENDRVLRDLTRYSPLKEQGYRYVMTDSPDSRGIDVALLYQRDRFKLLGHRSIGVDLGEGQRPTRDILHVTGIISTFDTIDVFVAHFPSRSGGQLQTEPNRLQAARILRRAADSLFAVRTTPRIIIMGDLNDYPANKSISKVLSAKAPKAPEADIRPNELYHLLARKVKGKRLGTYKYQGEWGLLDHLIVSGNLLVEASGVYTSEGHAHIVQLPFLLTKDPTHGGRRPFRTYYGMRYEGGYSDHLPVYFDLMIKEE